MLCRHTQRKECVHAGAVQTYVYILYTDKVPGTSYRGRKSDREVCALQDERHLSEPDGYGHP